jgi:hypothetical protein
MLMLRQFKFAEDILLGNTIAEGYQEQILSILKGKPFYLWDEHQHTEEYNRTNGQCCFNHYTNGLQGKLILVSRLLSGICH